MKLRFARSASWPDEVRAAVDRGWAEVIPDEEALALLDTFWNAGRSREENATEENVDPDQLRRGIKVEMEHTTDREVATKIALDHLAEYSDYYTGLAFAEALMEAGLLEPAMRWARDAMGLKARSGGQGTRRSR